MGAHLPSESFFWDVRCGDVVSLRTQEFATRIMSKRWLITLKLWTAHKNRCKKSLSVKPTQDGLYGPVIQKFNHFDFALQCIRPAYRVIYSYFFTFGSSKSFFFNQQQNWIYNSHQKHPDSSHITLFTRPFRIFTWIKYFVAYIYCVLKPNCRQDTDE